MKTKTKVRLVKGHKRDASQHRCSATYINSDNASIALAAAPSIGFDLDSLSVAI